MKNIALYLINLPNFYKKLILISIDNTILFFSIYLTIFLNSNIFNNNNSNFIYIALLVNSSINLLTGQYRGFTSYLSSSDFYKFIYRNTILTTILYFILFTSFNLNIGASQIILFYLLNTTLTTIIRIVFRDFLLFNRHFSNKNKIRVAIYGAGSAGRQLAAYLQFDNKYKLINFFDDADCLAGKELRGVKILKPELISKVRNSIDQILIAMPSLKRERRLEILDLLNQYNIPLFKIP